MVIREVQCLPPGLAKSADLAQYEEIIQLAASLPNGSQLRDDLSGSFIKTLWNNLQHPPISYLGSDFKYRAADGSNNVST